MIEIEVNFCDRLNNIPNRVHPGSTGEALRLTMSAVLVVFLQGLGSVILRLFCSSYISDDRSDVAVQASRLWVSCSVSQVRLHGETALGNAFLRDLMNAQKEEEN